MLLAVYCIGGLYVNMEPDYDELAVRAAPFICECDAKADICLRFDKDEIARRANRYGLTVPQAEYQLSCELFCEEVLKHNAFVLHASAVLLNGKVYMFSAPSGVGKSTHAALWKRLFGAHIINDDKPLIRLMDGVFYAFGTPWCGSGYERLNEHGQIKTLFFINRGKQNSLCDFDSDKALYLMLESMLRPDDNTDMDALIKSLDLFLRDVPVKGLICNTEDEAALLALAAAEERYED